MNSLRQADIPLDYGNPFQSPRLIVVHAIAEYIRGGSQDYHCIEFLRARGLSAHVFVTPTGVLIRSREDNQGAFHAGKGDDGKNYNLDSLGIEFMVPGVHNYESFKNAMHDGYLSADQYEAGIDQVKIWDGQHAIARIVRHSDLAPSRKSDPGDSFPWDDFLKRVGYEH